MKLTYNYPYETHWIPRIDYISDIRSMTMKRNKNDFSFHIVIIARFNDELCRIDIPRAYLTNGEIEACLATDDTFLKIFKIKEKR